MNRRSFIAKSAAALFGFTILPGAGRLWHVTYRPRMVWWDGDVAVASWPLTRSEIAAALLGGDISRENVSGSYVITGVQFVDVPQIPPFHIDISHPVVPCGGDVTAHFEGVKLARSRGELGEGAP